MAWTAGQTRATSDLITAAQWNSYLGASGSLEYLKTEADKHDDCSHTEPTRALDTVYQNSTKIRIVTVTLRLGGATDDAADCLIGSSNPPSTIVANADHEFAPTSGYHHPSITFVIPPNWYYKVAITMGNPSKQEWHEWDLL